MQTLRSRPDLPNLNLPLKQDLSVVNTGLATFLSLPDIEDLSSQKKKQKKTLRVAYPTHYFLEPEMSFNPIHHSHNFFSMLIPNSSSGYALPTQELYFGSEDKARLADECSWPLPAPTSCPSH